MYEVNIMKDLEILKTEIPIGLPAPVRFLHITDCHISLWDEYDKAEDPDKPGLAEARRREFDEGCEGQSEHLYLQALDYAKREGMPVVCTGDLVDFLSHANFAYMDKTLADVDYIYAAGNHDFCHFVGRAIEDYAYKWEKIKIAQPHVKQNLIFDSRVIGGVNFVTMDDSYYLFTDGQIELLRAEAAKGYPILLFLHVPLHTEKHYAYQRSLHDCGYLTASPEEALATFSANRRAQQTPDASTLRAVEYITNEPRIRAVIAGHTHNNWEEPLSSGKMQYITAGTFQGYAREFILK